jgi:hypothetical protein
MRFDNGLPWASKSDIPSALSLYWRGLAIRISYGRPAISTDNACVERTHQMVEQWAEPLRNTSETWQKALDWAVQLQREEYPYDEQRCSRSEHFGASLRHSGRNFTDQQTDMMLVYAFLQTALFQRSVDTNGRITILQTRTTLGRQYAGTTVFLQFANGYWVARDEDDLELKRWKSTEIILEHLQRGFYNPHQYYQNSHGVKEQ